MLLQRGSYCTLPALRHDATTDVIDVLCGTKTEKKVWPTENRCSIMWCRFLHAIDKKRKKIYSYFLFFRYIPIVIELFL